MPNSLQEMVPTREWSEPIGEHRAGAKREERHSQEGSDHGGPRLADGQPGSGGAPKAPGLRRFSIDHLPNPLLALGLTDLVWARGFLNKLEMDLQELHRQQMSRPMALTVNGLSYAPMARMEAELDELSRHEREESGQKQASVDNPSKRSNRADAPGPVGGAMLDEAAARLAQELWSSSAGNLELATLVMDHFWSKFSQESFRTPDLMSLLLVAHEEVIWETQNGSSGAMGGAPSSGELRVGVPSLHLQAQSADPDAITEEMIARTGRGRQHGAASREHNTLAGLRIVATAPQMEGAAVVIPFDEMRSEFSGAKRAAIHEKKVGQDLTVVADLDKRMRTAMKEDVEVRLISIREMLWHYFQAYPQDYPAALAAVLNLNLAQVGDAMVLDERIALEVARGGSWSLALRVWQEIVKHQKMRELMERGKGRRGEELEAKFFSQGMVPPDLRMKRSWWSLSPNWSGMGFGAALRALARKIFS